jgi:hypothetical protein
MASDVFEHVVDLRERGEPVAKGSRRPPSVSSKRLFDVLVSSSAPRR